MATGMRSFETGAQVLGVDWNDFRWRCAARLPANVGVQGNLDPVSAEHQPGT